MNPESNTLSLYIPFPRGKRRLLAAVRELLGLLCGPCDRRAAGHRAPELGQHILAPAEDVCSDLPDARRPCLDLRQPAAGAEGRSGGGSGFDGAASAIEREISAVAFGGFDLRITMISLQARQRAFFPMADSGTSASTPQLGFEQRTRIVMAGLTK